MKGWCLRFYYNIRDSNSAADLIPLHFIQLKSLEKLSKNNNKEWGVCNSAYVKRKYSVCPLSCSHHMGWGGLFLILSPATSALSPLLLNPSRLINKQNKNKKPRGHYHTTATLPSKVILNKGQLPLGWRPGILADPFGILKPECWQLRP